MTNINWQTFVKVITDSTSNYSKIKKEDYLKEGLYRIIDQSQTFLGGYTNNKDLVNDVDLPVIVFGDHTRILKYIDFPFAIGADGVKVLRINKEVAYPKYVYYFLKSVKLTDAGYSRHFKFLKELKIPVPNLEDQIRIANILSKVEALISQRKESLRLLDEFLKSTFLEMFGDQVKNPKAWDIKLFGDVIESIRYGTSTPPEYQPEGIPFIRATNVKKGRISKKDLVYISDAEAAKISKCKINEGDLIIVRSGANTGDSATIPKEFDNAYAAYDLIIKLNRISSVFYNELINSEYGRTKIKPLTQRSGQPHLNSDQVKSLKFYYPPMELQIQFFNIVDKTERLKASYQNSLRELENLYGSLSQRAFKGDLDLSGMKVDLPEHQESVNTRIGRDSAEEKLIINIPPKQRDKFNRTVASIIVSVLSPKFVADRIINRYKNHHFSFEMLLKFLEREKMDYRTYFSSEEIKKDLKLNESEDLKNFLHNAIVNVARNDERDRNPFLKLEQHFYNAEKENFQLKVTSKDYDLIKGRDPRERSGIYFTVVQ